MVEKFPELHELLWLFESEPELHDDLYYWPYINVTCRTQRHGFDVMLSVAVAEGMGSVELSSQDNTLATLQFANAQEIAVVHAKDRQGLILKFGGNDVLPLELDLEPRVQLRWGTALSYHL